jgi:hypothetical protein
VGEEEDWRPPKARLRAALWRAEGHLERREYVAAASALEEVFGLGDRDFLHGLYHLAAAGYRHQLGQADRARRQLGHARRRLARHRRAARLLELVERELGS